MVLPFTRKHLRAVANSRSRKHRVRKVQSTVGVHDTNGRRDIISKCRLLLWIIYFSQGFGQC